jgi:hypothetical protein
MAQRQHAGYERRRLVGRILVTLGTVALLADLSFLAQPLEHLAEKLGQGLFALLPTLGLSFLNAARAIAFQQIDYFSFITRILVSFTAMVAMIVGIALLRSPYPRSTNADHLRSAFRQREIDNG